MGSAELSLGRILGVRVGMSWGLVAIGAFFTLTLALSQYPAAFPGRTGAEYWVAGAATTALFTLSILVHELGHAVVARGDGVGVDGVTLWMFGGVARLTSLPRTAGAEARIALAGPAATGVTSGVFWLLTMLADDGGRPSIAVTMFDWLTRTNLLLLALNLLPALPLDGGRVLGAAVWGASGRRDTGVLAAARSGWVVGIALGLFGIIGVQRGSFEGLWAVLIALFVLSSSREAERERRRSGRWQGRTAGDAMRTGVPTADAWLRVDAFLTHLQDVAPSGGHDVFPVRGPDDGEVLGVVRLERLLTVPDADRRFVTVAELTEPRRDVPVVAVDEPLAEVVDNHPEILRGTVMVVDRAGRVVGVLGPECLALP